MSALSPLVSADMAQAADWTGAAGQNWFNVGNWNPNAVPAAGTSVGISIITPNSPIIDGAAASAGVMTIGANPGPGNGKAKLDIINGGTLSSASATLGNNVGEMSQVTVSGPGSAWTNTGALVISKSGYGELLVTNGGQVKSNGITVAEHATAPFGLVTVDGAGSSLTSTSFLYLGGESPGHMYVTNGGTVSNGYAEIAHGAAAHSYVTVSGKDSLWTSSGGLVVGGAGTAEVKILDGGQLSSAWSTLAAETGSHAFAEVSGVGSRWNNSQFLTVGVRGEADLNIIEGAVVTSTDGRIGFEAGSTGRVYVWDPGSTWENTGALLVGVAGRANLDVANGASVNSVGAIIGGDVGSKGFVTVGNTGSKWTNTADLVVGQDGSGELLIAHGGQVINTAAILGRNAGSKGTVTVKDAGSLWTSTNSLSVGGAGEGTLKVLDGGQVKSLKGAVANEVGSAGHVVVSGANARWDMTQGLTVGGYGNGEIAILQGGALTNGHAVIGSEAGSFGLVGIEGAGSTWTNAGSLTVGDYGAAVLRILDGGTVTSVGATIGAKAGSNGVALLMGSGSTWINSTNLTIGSVGQGTLILRDGSQLNVTGNIVIAEQAGSVGKLVIGDTTPEALAGHLTAPRIKFGAGNGALIFNHESTDYVFDTVIEGKGTIEHWGGSTIYTGNGNAFTGTTTVSGGVLSVNGSLGGELNILAAGRLQGTGTVGNTIVSGTIAPGNSIGTLNVGNITFNAGSIYEVEVNAAGQSDLIKASGTATINGGSVKVLAGSGNYALQTKYTILTATGGRSGTFTGGVTSNLAFLDPSLSYDANNVYLTMTRNDISFQNVGVTANQIAAGNGVESLGFGNSIYDAVLNLSAPQAQYAFDQLSGEIHASTRTALIEDSRFVRTAVNDRLRAAFDGVGAAKGDVVTYVDGKPVAVAATTDRLAVWGQGFGSWGRTDGNGNAARLNRKTGGFFVGADAPVFDTWRFGALAGYSRTDFDVKSRHSSGVSDNYHLGLYGGTSWGVAGGELAFRTGAAYTWHDISISRNVSFPGFGNSLKADYNAATAQVFGELSYGFNAGGARFEPFANLAYVNLRTDGFTERGGAAALTSPSTKTDAAFSTLGLRTSTTFNMGGAMLTAKGMFGWRHAFGDVTPLSTMRFASGGNAFSIGGIPLARNAAVIEVGLDYMLAPNAILGVTYGGQFGSAAIDQTFRANFNVKF